MQVGRLNPSRLSHRSPTGVFVVSRDGWLMAGEVASQWNRARVGRGLVAGSCVELGGDVGYGVGVVGVSFGLETRPGGRQAFSMTMSSDTDNKIKNFSNLHVMRDPLSMPTPSTARRGILRRCRGAVQQCSTQ